jgi:hypothetical protein
MREFILTSEKKYTLSPVKDGGHRAVHHAIRS